MTIHHEFKSDDDKDAAMEAMRGEPDPIPEPTAELPETPSYADLLKERAGLARRLEQTQRERDESRERFKIEQLDRMRAEREQDKARARVIELERTIGALRDYIEILEARKP